MCVNSDEQFLTANEPAKRQPETTPPSRDRRHPEGVRGANVPWHTLLPPPSDGRRKNCLEGL